MKSLDQLDFKLDQNSTKLDQANTTIDQVNAKAEKRIDVLSLAGDGNSNFVIDQPGSYYLSGNLSVTKVNGISVTAVDVTIDLNGFAIRRTAGSGGAGISIPPEADHCIVKNGLVNGFAIGIDCPFISIFTGSAEGCSFSNLVVSGCSNFGLRAGTAPIIEKCEAVKNGGGGIFAASGATITGCSAYGNGGVGINASGQSVIQSCTATLNGGNGLQTDLGGVVSQSTSRNNTGDGINVGDGSTVQGCATYFNTGDNIEAGSGCLITRNTASNSNGSNGIRVADGCHLLENTCRDNNNQSGILVTGAHNRIEGNACTSNNIGFSVTGTNNLIIKNSASENPDAAGTNNYIIGAGNRSAFIVLPNSSVPGGPTGINTTDPWANFGY
jgi:parallel beta-helix repeat protein